MQVKKFEARTMKEALEMVKVQLGPEAIILSARDNQKSFGLVGEGSVEITAAISEESLQKRRITESKMRDQDRERFSRSPARVQKTIIDQVIANHTQNRETKEKQYRPITSQRYADIIDDSNEMTENPAQARIKDAALRAWEAMNERGGSPFFPSSAPNPSPVKGKNNSTQHSNSVPTSSGSQKNESSRIEGDDKSQEIFSLRHEIQSLKSMIHQFQQENHAQSTAAAQASYPGAGFGIPYEFSFVFEKLKNEGVQDQEIISLIEKSRGNLPLHRLKNKALVEGLVARRMLDVTSIAAPSSEKRYHFFWGPAGSGKTSALVKLASHKVVNENKKVVLLTTDQFKVGAAEQLRIFAQILNVPSATMRQAQDWVKIKPHLDKMDCVFVDFPGLNLKRSDEVKMLESIVPGMISDAQHHLVLSALGKFEDLLDIFHRYSSLRNLSRIDDFIFTNIDQCVQFGNLFSLMLRTQIPIHSFGMGPRLPEDFEYASKERVLDLIFKITQSSNRRDVNL